MACQDPIMSIMAYFQGHRVKAADYIEYDKNGRIKPLDSFVVS